MIIEQQNIKGLFTVQNELFQDDRGYFTRTYCREEFENGGIFEGFVQMNQSFNKLKGTLRGMHYQTGNFSEAKFVRCVKGAIFDVVIDLRQESETYLQTFSIELSDINNKGLYIPTGFAHGFQTLCDDTIVLYCHSNRYSPGNESGIPYNDPLLNINWPLPISKISDRDKSYNKLIK
ncbi:MAG: dTDP-4-dehydrorhamnose 3,5-epimerase [Crocinitomicaceae bacterium]